jgi:cyclopropane-fatty-acyl-phospholipid synthase
VGALAPTLAPRTPVRCGASALRGRAGRARELHDHVPQATFPDAAYKAQRRGANWIPQDIFPGGLCPSLAVIERSTHATSLLITDVDDIAPHYVRTLRAWRTRFLDQVDAVRAMGFDDRFMRIWEYDLALSEAGFATDLTQDLQVVLEKRRGTA